MTKTTNMKMVSKDEKLDDDWIRIADYADKNCKRCYGTGECGINTTTSKMIPCRCVIRNWNKVKISKARGFGSGF